MDTELELYQAFKTICNLETKELAPTIKLPEQLNPAPHMEIINPNLFITTALNRLSSSSPRLRGISERMLKAFINSMENGSNSNTTGFSAH